MTVDVNTQPDKSIGTLVRNLTQDISTLFRSEIALAKLEIRQAVTGLGGVGALFAVALFCALFGAVFLLVTTVLALALVMPAWAASLLLAVVLLLVAAVIAMVGMKKMKKLKLVPTGAIEHVKQDIDTIKSELSKSRGRT